MRMIEPVPAAPLDTRVPRVVRIENASLDEGDDGSIVMRGRISRDTLRFLRVDHDYQRKLSNRPEIAAAFRAGIIVPDIDVGVRGGDFTTEGSDALIHSPAYLIDGAQRVGTALAILEDDPNLEVRIGALVHFDTSPAWEAQRFTALNLNTKRVSASLHLRNLRDRNTAVLTLYGLSNSDPNSVLRGLVCWEQSMQRRELMTAPLVVETTLRLHGHLTGMPSRRADEMAARLQITANKVGLPTFRANVNEFFTIVDGCWGLRSIEYRYGASQVKGGFLTTLAKVFSNHTDFWSGNAFRVDADTKRKLKGFAINDPQVKQLVGATGAARDILYQLLVKHINSGRREHRLHSRFET